MSYHLLVVLLKYTLYGACELRIGRQSKSGWYSLQSDFMCWVGRKILLTDSHLLQAGSACWSVIQSVWFITL